MTDAQATPTATRASNRRRKLRLAARGEREARKEQIFSQLVSGMSHATIARRLGCSLQSVRKIIARELDNRRIDPAADFAKLQIARLNNALLAANGQMIDGDMAGFDRVLKVVAELDRYHGLAQALEARGPDRRAFAALAGPRPGAPRALPAPDRAQGARALGGGDKSASQALEKPLPMDAMSEFAHARD